MVKGIVDKRLIVAAANLTFKGGGGAFFHR